MVTKQKLCQRCNYDLVSRVYATGLKEYFRIKLCATCKQYKLDSKRLEQYDMTPEDYNYMYDKQAGRCGICGKHQQELKRRLSVDHNHKTGQVRGLLCTNCNFTVGIVETNDIDRINRYLAVML